MPEIGPLRRRMIEDMTVVARCISCNVLHHFPSRSPESRDAQLVHHMRRDFVALVQCPDRSLIRPAPKHLWVGSWVESGGHQ